MRMSFRFPVAELAGSCHAPNEEAVVYDQCGVHITSNTRSMAGLSLEELVVDTAVATDHVVENGRNISFEATLRGS